MNPLIKKEIRLLLPGMLIGCGLAALNLLPGQMWGREYTELAGLRGVIIFLLCPTMAIMIALNSFGVEVTTGTFTSLLAQPVARLKIWQTKIVLLAVALLAMGSMWTCAVYVHYAKSPGDLYELSGWMVLFVLVVYSGALWTVLLLRQAAAAFWFTVLVPGAILVISSGLLGGEDDDLIEGILVIALGIYTLTGLFFARWLFLRAQDVQWSGGTITMPEMRGSPAWLSRLMAWRATHPTLALWRKEFQLQQSQFIIAFVLVILHLGVLATRKLEHFGPNSTTKFILENFWWLWLAMPFIVGCAAVAEERKMGTHEGQLCLPVKRRTQFAIKLSVVLLLSLVFGVVIPLLFEGHKLFGDNMSLFGLTRVVAGMGLITFYISSLTRSTLQAMAPALGYIAIVFFLIGEAQLEKMAAHPLWGSALIFVIGAPVLALMFLALAYQNFRQLTVSLGVWLKNLLTLAATLVFIVVTTTEIYHRVWEKLTPFEPPHGVAHLTLYNPATVSENWDGVSVRLPDGKMWMNRFFPKIDKQNGHFLDGSNWANVFNPVWIDRPQWVGLKTDGTLWVSKNPQSSDLTKNGAFSREWEKLSQFGNETNWSSATPYNLSVLLVKNDGTLWRWGYPTNFDFKHKKWPGLQAFTPQQVGTESDWAEVNQKTYQIFLRKTDGSLWTRVDNWNTNGQTMLQIAPWFTAQSLKSPGFDKFRSITRVEHGLQYNLGVRDDGTFRIWADERLALNKNEHYGSYEWYPTDLQIGNGTNWIAATGEGDKIVTLKSDGSLWLWDFYHDSQLGWDTDMGTREIQAVRPSQLGIHSDWIAIAGDYGYVLSLAADGSLWYWPIENSRSHEHNNDFMPLLDISHKPQYLGNVFEGDSGNR